MFEGNLQFYKYLFCFILHCCFITAKYLQVIDDYVRLPHHVLNVLRMFLTFKMAVVTMNLKTWPMQLGYIKIQILCIAALS